MTLATVPGFAVPSYGFVGTLYVLFRCFGFWWNVVASPTSGIRLLRRLECEMPQLLGLPLVGPVPYTLCIVSRIPDSRRRESPCPRASLSKLIELGIDSET